jgi:predicted RNA-binding Zn-ribbon protein involved in translation (DUF1610 family)
MVKGLFGKIGKGARWIIQPAVGVIHRYRRNRRISQALDETFSLDRDGRYGEAAAIYTHLADEYIEANSLIYQLYSHDSFRMWLKAKNVENALHQAGDVLRVLSDTGWINNSSEAVDDLSKMVGELYVAGYVTEAGGLSNEINQKLKAHGVPPRAVSTEASGAAVAFKGSQFASICPQCGGALPPANSEAEIKCPYCGSIIHAS